MRTIGPFVPTEIPPIFSCECGRALAALKSDCARVCLSTIMAQAICRRVRERMFVARSEVLIFLHFDPCSLCWMGISFC